MRHTVDLENDLIQVPLVTSARQPAADLIGESLAELAVPYQAIASHQSDPPPDVVIPPRASAVPGTENVEAPSQRDRHIRIIAEKGRMGWQRATGYGRRSLAETAVGRYKAIIGPKLRARLLPAQQGEVAVAAEVLNRMICAAKPVSTRVA
jgi:hypothetical protein